MLTNIAIPFTLKQKTSRQNTWTTVDDSDPFITIGYVGSDSDSRIYEFAMIKLDLTNIPVTTKIQTIIINYNLTYSAQMASPPRLDVVERLGDSNDNIFWGNSVAQWAGSSKSFSYDSSLLRGIRQELANQTAPATSIVWETNDVSNASSQSSYYINMKNISVVATIDLPDISQVIPYDGLDENAKVTENIQFDAKFLIKFSEVIPATLENVKIYLRPEGMSSSLVWQTTIQANTRKLTMYLQSSDPGGAWLIANATSKQINCTIFYTFSGTNSNTISQKVILPEGISSASINISLIDKSNDSEIKTLIRQSSSSTTYYMNRSLLQLEVNLNNANPNLIKTLSIQDIVTVNNQSQSEPLQNILGVQEFIPQHAGQHTITVTIVDKYNETIVKTFSYNVKNYTEIILDTISYSWISDNTLKLSFSTITDGNSFDNNNTNNTRRIGVGTLAANRSYTLFQGLRQINNGEYSSNNAVLSWQPAATQNTSVTESNAVKITDNSYSASNTYSFDIFIIPNSTDTLSAPFLLHTIIVQASTPIIDFYSQSGITSIGLGGLADETQSNITCHLPLIVQSIYYSSLNQVGGGSSSSSSQQKYSVQTGIVSANTLLNINNANAIISITQEAPETLTLTINGNTFTTTNSPQYHLVWDSSDWKIVESNIIAYQNGTEVKWTFWNGDNSIKYHYIAYIPTT